MAVRISRRYYNSIVERHSNMPVVGMDTTFVISSLQSAKLELGIDLPISLIAI